MDPNVALLQQWASLQSLAMAAGAPSVGGTAPSFGGDIGSLAAIQASMQAVQASAPAAPSGTGKGKGKGKKGKAEDSENKQMLLEGVKTIQRSSEYNKMQWYTFCHMQPTWVYDPNRHDERSLQGFLDKFDSDLLKMGPAQEVGLGESKDDLAARVTQVQKNTGLKECWIAYVMWFNLSYDLEPETHEAKFLQCFLNCVIAGSLPHDENDIVLDDRRQLVERIKKIQRKGFREHWMAFCQMFKWTSNYDPGRHQDRFLTKFVDACELVAPLMGIEVSELQADHYQAMQELDETTASPQIFVGGLPRGVDRSAVWEHFSLFGVVRDVQLKVDESGAHRGFGFVKFDSAETAYLALTNSDGYLLQGKQLNVRPATGKSTKKKDFKEDGKGKASGKGSDSDSWAASDDWGAGWGSDPGKGGDWSEDDWAWAGMEMMMHMMNSPTGKGTDTGKGKGKGDQSGWCGGGGGSDDWGTFGGFDDAGWDDWSGQMVAPPGKGKGKGKGKDKGKGKGMQRYSPW